MFSSLTATGTIEAAEVFAQQIVPVALIVAGAAVAVGLTGWVVRRMRRAAR